MPAPRPHLLDAEEVARRLDTQPQWQRRGESLYREVVFARFEQAFAFMTAAAAAAEALDHHPDWRNVYNRVWITLSTHDAGGITALDFELAARMEALIEGAATAAT